MTATTVDGPGVGTILPPLSCELTRETLVRYAGASGDFNPIHYSDHAAASLGLPGVIAHGMLTMGVAVRVVTEWAGPGATLVSYFARFTRPVVVPADGPARLEVSGVVTAVEGSAVTVTLEATCGGEKVLGAAKVVVDLGAGVTAPETTPVLGAGIRLADHTTLRVGGPARRFVEVTTTDDLVGVVRELDAAGEPVLVLGGGSNLLVGDDGFAGTVVKVATRGVVDDVAACSGAVVTVAAGEPWDPFVALTVERGWSGLEALSGIPGSVGATPIQNVGAYGADVGQLVTTVRTLDRSTGAIRTLFAVECGFGYRSSRFKSEPGRYLVLEVTLQLKLGSLSAPVRYAELARTLGVGLGTRVPAAEVRAAVLALRAGKGMVLDDADPDTWSAGSFFTNPVVGVELADRLPADAPRFAQPDGRVKTSAAWLIEHAGFRRGFGTGRARLSDKHTLALTNRGSADAEDVLSLARTVRAGVRDAYGITLVPEPVLVGCEL